MNRRHVIGLIALFACRPALAGEIRPSGGGDFSVWTPSGWKVTKPDNRVAANAPDESLYLSAEQLPLAAAGLKGIDVAAILDRELDDFDITVDELRAVDGVPYRRLEGAGVDEGDKVLFRMRVISHPSRPLALVALVWGENEDMADAATSGIADQILKSLKGL